MVTRSFDYPFAAVSGILLALSFPTFGHPAFAWIALVPLLVVLSGDGQPLRRAFALGLTTGIIYFTGTLYWITNVMAVYGDLPRVVAAVLNLALVAYLALFPAFFAVVVRRLIAAAGPAMLITAPLVWVATELGRTYLFTGFPWVLIGYSQVTLLPIAQLASLFGVYGLSALVTAMSAAAAFALVTSTRPIDSRRTGGALPIRFAPPVTVVGLVIVTTVWGSARIARGELTQEGSPVRIGLVQGNVDQAQKWDDARAGVIFQDYLRMTRQAIAAGAQFVLWPESSTSFYFEEHRAGAEQIRSIARESHVSILIGSDQIEHSTPPRYYNAAFMVGADGSTGGVYRKMHLVPFGEYVPLKRLLFFAAPLVQAVSDFSEGQDAVLLPVDRHLVSTAICYEVVYPNLVRRFALGGSELLTTITNDAWFGRSSAPYQHFEQASLRAIEEGRYLVRAANTGISGIVDPYGRVVSRSEIFQPAVIVGAARFLKSSTFYMRSGDIFAYAAAVVTLSMLATTRTRKRRVE